MKKYDPSLFFRELRRSIESFYGTSGSDSRCQMSDFVYSLQGITSMLLRTNNDCANPDYIQAMEALGTVSDKLTSAHCFRDLVANLKGLNGKRHRDERLKLLEQLLDLVRFCYMNISLGRRL